MTRMAGGSYLLSYKDLVGATSLVISQNKAITNQSMNILCSLKCPPNWLQVRARRLMDLDRNNRQFSDCNHIFSQININIPLTLIGKNVKKHCAFEYFSNENPPLNGPFLAIIILIES